MVNEETRHTFRVRSQVIAHIRRFLSERGFLEVETPMLQTIPGGAAPFETHHNALDMAMFLRIAPELYLKRLVVGGFEKVFEINRNFRNEGVSTRHNPEFTMLEFYQAYADYEDNMDLTEELFRELAQAVLGTTDVPYGDKVFHFGEPFVRLSVFDSILKYNPEISAADLNDVEKARAIARRPAPGPRPRRPGQAAGDDFRGTGGAQAGAAALHHPLPLRGFAAGPPQRRRPERH